MNIKKFLLAVFFITNVNNINGVNRYLNISDDVTTEAMKIALYFWGGLLASHLPKCIFCDKGDINKTLNEPMPSYAMPIAVLCVCYKIAQYK